MRDAALRLSLRAIEMMKKILLLVVLATAATAGAQGTFAPSAAAVALARKVDAHYNHLHSLTAQFTERYRGMGIDRTETGTLDAEQAGQDAVGV